MTDIRTDIATNGYLCGYPVKFCYLCDYFIGPQVDFSHTIQDCHVSTELITFKYIETSDKYSHLSTHLCIRTDRRADGLQALFWFF